MKVRPIIDVSGYSPYNQNTASPLFWGMLGMILIETMVFASLVSAYFYLRAHAPEWPPGGVEPPKLMMPTVATVILIISSGFLHWGDTGIRKGDSRRLSIGMLVAALLGVVFLVLKAIEYSQKSYRWDSHVYGSIVWTIAGFHSAHVMALLLKTLVVDTLAFRGYFNRERRLGVTINGVYWHFVVAIWIPLYVVIYIVPRL